MAAFISAAVSRGTVSVLQHHLVARRLARIVPVQAGALTLRIVPVPARPSTRAGLAVSTYNAARADGDLVRARG